MGLIDHGTNYLQRNQVRRLHNAGIPHLQIVNETGLSERLVLNCIAELESKAAPKAPSVLSDQFGPLPSSPDWPLLSPGARSGLTRKRKNLEAKNGDHSTI